MMLVPMMRYGADSTAGAVLDDRMGMHAKMLNSLPFFWLHAIFGLIVGVLFIAILVAILRLLWKKGSK